MKISLSWLRDYLRTDKPAAEIARILTDAGLEVGSIESTGVAIPKVVAAQILESIQHPNADRLSVCKVDDGSGTPRQIVCGAKNYKVGDKVPLAQPGAVMPGDFKIKVGKLRGVESEGMMCSSKELGLGEGADGLLILSPETAIGTPLCELFPAEEVFEIEITPNRPDWLGHVGVAREAAAFGCGELISPTPALPSTKEDASVAAIAAPAAASFYSIHRIDGVKVGPSPEWLRKRLESVGLRSINNIVDITNFVMFETAQPLHAFDAGKIEGALTVRFANEEALTSLDGKEYKLTAHDLVIADAKGPQAIAGITGGVESGVSETTTSILLESALFEPTVIRRSSRALGISTDSSYRFERGVDAQGALAASARAAALIVELAGGMPSAELVIAGSLPATRVVALRCDRVRSLLGIDLEDDSIAILLTKLGLKKIASEAALGFEIPSWRNDLTREVDLIEEVARLHGINSITAKCAGIPAHSSDADKAYDFAHGLRRRLSGGGFHEARSGTLTGSRDQEAFSTGGVIAVRNPMGEEHSTLRASLIPGLLEAVSRNLRHGTNSIRLFEIGKVYQQEQPEESMQLGLVMTGRTAPENWRGKEEGERSLDLYDLKGVIQLLGTRLEPITFRAATHASLPLALEILIAGKPAGILGVLSPSATRELMVGGHQGQIVVAELDLHALQAASGIGLSKDPKKHGLLHKFPAVRRDLALLMDAATPYTVVEQAVLAAQEELLSAVTPFDVFSDPEGVKVPLGKKSLAIALTFLHPERTLTTEEVNAAVTRIVAQLREAAGAEVRG
ncbi:MAG: phenylalanine--tRNA ligase subunit beta [Verrucomicrobia bacterium]|nr:phenylalanine--tRNA ligase subunit beta [Verrucomicrobiota bacterium]